MDQTFSSVTWRGAWTRHCQVLPGGAHGPDIVKCYLEGRMDQTLSSVSWRGALTRNCQVLPGGAHGPEIVKCYLEGRMDQTLSRDQPLGQIYKWFINLLPTMESDLQLLY